MITSWVAGLLNILTFCIRIIPQKVSGLVASQWGLTIRENLVELNSTRAWMSWFLRCFKKGMFSVSKQKVFSIKRRRIVVDADCLCPHSLVYEMGLSSFKTKGRTHAGGTRFFRLPPRKGDGRFSWLAQEWYESFTKFH